MAMQTNGVWVPPSIVCFIEVLVVCLFILKSHMSANATNVNEAEVAFCTCDLNRGACDVNCCCDPDCTLEDHKAFSNCTNYYNPSSKDTCVQSSIIFINNSKFVVDSSQPGLFCIYFDNYPLSRTFLNVTVINTSAEFENYVMRYGKQYFRRQHYHLPVENLTLYKSGDPVLVVHENLAIGFLSLPRRLNSESCIDSNPVSYMIPQKFSCTRPETDIKLQCTSSRMWNASTYYKGFKVVKNSNTFSPIYGNFTHLMSEYAHQVIMQEERFRHHLPPSDDDPLTKDIILAPLYDSSDLTDVEPDSDSVCFDADGGKRTCGENPFKLPSPSLKVDKKSFICANVVSKLSAHEMNQSCRVRDSHFKVMSLQNGGAVQNMTQVKYTVIYNNTEGIRSVKVHFILRDIEAKDLPLRQSFEVIYLQPSHKLPRGPEMASPVRHKKSERSDSKKPEKYSGNPGYLVGAPLRVGTLETGHHWKTAAIKIMDDDQPGLTMLSSDLNGDCQTTQSREAVRFGVNMRSGCFIRFNFTDLSKACNQSQWATWVALRGHDPPTHVATYGNSDPHVVGDWVEILEADARPHPDSAVYEDQRPGICFNILSGLDIQIIFAKTGSFENAQAQIIGARFNYLYMNYLQCLGPACHSSANGWEQKFEVVSSVTFTDASKPAIGVEGIVKYIHASLPLNFFYPFGSEDV